MYIPTCTLTDVSWRREGCDVPVPGGEGIASSPRSSGQTIGAKMDRLHPNAGRQMTERR
jgi:hypothetical protein